MAKSSALTRPVPTVSWDERVVVRNPAAHKGEYLGSMYAGWQPPYKYTIGQPTSGASLVPLEKAALHPVVKPALDIRIAACFSRGFSVVSRNDNPDWQELDDWILSTIQRQVDNLLDDGLEGIARSFLRNGIVYGLLFGEKVWVASAEGYDLVRVKTRPTSWVDIYTDAADNVDRIYWIPNGTWLVGNALRDLVMSPYPTLLNGNVYGTSDLLAILQDLATLDILEQYRVQGVSRIMLRTTVVHHHGEDNDATRTSVLENFLKLDSGSVMTAPMVRESSQGATTAEKWVKGYEVEVLDDRASAEGLKTTTEIIIDLQKRVTRALGIPDDLGTSTVASGSYAKAEAEARTVFASRVRQDQQWVARTINREIIGAMIRYNFPHLPDRYRLPEFSFEPEAEEWAGDIAAQAIILRDAGLVTDNWVQERLGLPVTTPEETASLQLAGPAPVVNP